MFDHIQIMTWLGVIVTAAPLLLMALLGVSSLVGRSLSESATGKVSQAGIAIGLLAALGVLGAMLLTDTRHFVINLGAWVALDHQAPAQTDQSHYHFVVKLIFDRLSVPFVILSFVLCGTIGAFAVRYMHRERGYNRFF